ncbi:MAG: type II toxin-antitoxin system PemK/MazF family toxin [Clostridia bacterium]|nr:type II toxin-antitoxin system PemK/MazF family toxin [Clostridia bacterium]
MNQVKRGDIYYADLSPVVGSEQGGVRPVLIIQNDVGNRYSPTVIAAAITSRMSKTKLPTHIEVYATRAGLSRDSVVLLEQLRTLDKRRLKEKMGHLDEGVMQEIDNAIAVSLGLFPHAVRADERGGAAPAAPVALGAPPPAAVAAVTVSQTTTIRPQGGESAEKGSVLG